MPDTTKKTAGSRAKTTATKQPRITAKKELAGTPKTEVSAPSKTELTVAPVAPKMAPSREDIARRAYEIYVARGKTDGRDLEDWIQAERELVGAKHRNN